MDPIVLLRDGLAALTMLNVAGTIILVVATWYFWAVGFYTGWTANESHTCVHDREAAERVRRSATGDHTHFETADLRYEGDSKCRMGR